MKARFINQIGLLGQLRIYWDKVRGDKEYEDGYISNKNLWDCPCAYGIPNSNGIHNAYAPIGIKEGIIDDWDSFGQVKDYSQEKWPTECKHCGKLVPSDSSPTKLGEEGFCVIKQVFVSRLYNTDSGKPEPGDIYYLQTHEPGKCYNWDSCNGNHLYGISPSGEEWDIDSRANNCTMKEDRNHRCWIRTGNPADGSIHVDKNGYTCAAGAGSIVLPKWHGFLHHGNWVKC